MAARKLKVFQARLGFYDTVVAAASQAAALRAWGVHQNLFASGDAKATTDEDAARAARAHPETPLRRAIGSAGSFSLDPSGLPEIPDAPKRAAGKAPVRRKSPAPARPAPDRSRLDAAEQALRALETRRKGEETDLRREQVALDARRQSAQRAYAKARTRAAAAIAKAKAAYARAACNRF